MGNSLSARARKVKGNGKPASRGGNLLHEVSAGGVIFRKIRGGMIQVILVKPAGRDSWVLPKGHLEEGESMLDAARREAREETGLEVSVVTQLGDVAYFFSKRRKNGTLQRIFKRVRFFLMNCEGGDTSRHDDEIDEVQWLPLPDALKRATYDNERELLERAARAIGD